jgi:GMP synthase (glutamine-hydrolysing)
MKPFLILETGTPIVSLRRHGSFGHWIRVAAGLPGRQASHLWVAEGEALPDVADYAGVLVTGSGAMVTERHAWSERTAAWLRDAAGGGHALFGICFGHQLLAHALGGIVDWNPRGREMGTVPVSLDPAAGHDPLFSGLPATVHVHATHLQTVLSPPPQAQVLARSAHDDCQAFRWGEAAWGVQFHPEFNTGVMRGYIAARSDALEQEGRCHRRMLRDVRPAPLARRVLRRFIHVARDRAGNGSRA